MAGRSVVVTGAGAGIGRAVARRFVEEGDVVHLADLSKERLDAAAEEIGRPDQVHLHVVDVSDYYAVAGLVAEVVEHSGLIDVVVNNAGVFDGYASVLETTPELWAKIISVNLTGCFHGSKAAAEHMVPRGAGRIINIGSVAGVRGAADGLAYTASKAGIEGMTRRLAVDVAPHGVTANVVAPGVIATDIRANSGEILGDLVDMDRGVGASPELMDFLIPAHRPGDPREIAATVFFLASDEAAYLNGQVLHVDGGWTAT